MRKLIIQIAALLLLCSGIYAEEEPEFEITPGMKLEQKMVAERLKIKSGRVIVLYLDYLPSGINEGEEYPQKRRRIYESDGVNSREEHPDRRSHDYVYNRVTIGTEKEFIRVTSYKNTLFIEQTKQTNPSPRRFIWSPVMFGSNFHYKIAWKIFSRDKSLTMKERVNHPDRFNEKITDETLNGIPVKHVSYELPKGKHVEYWLAPGQGYTLLKVINKSMMRRTLGTMKGIKKQNVELTYTYEYEWKQYPSGIWFPTRWKSVFLQDNVVRSDREHVIEQADFTTPIRPKRFTIQSVTNTKKKIIYYNGRLHYTPDGIITDKEYLNYLYKIGGPPPSVEENNAKKWGKPFVAVILVLLAVVLINQRRKNKWKA